MASPTADRLMTWFSSFFQASSVSAGQPQSLGQQCSRCGCADAEPHSRCTGPKWQKLALCGAAQASVAQGSSGRQCFWTARGYLVATLL